MSIEVIESWLKSGRTAAIGQQFLRPVEHKRMRGKPLSSQKGQATAFFLTDKNMNWWILKKFHPNCPLDCSYLNQISSLLPKAPGFACGTERQILTAGTLSRAKGCHYSRALDGWLAGTILMPRIDGYDWAGMADEIRDGSIKLDDSHRLTICKNLTELIDLLENANCCHRDLSCGNVFIDPNTWQVNLIDFDSLYHPSLTIPQSTTAGTTGYTSHQVWVGNNPDAGQTWCPYTDRYALALLNVEFLLVDSNSKVTGEGGIFHQDELRNQNGPGLKAILSQLKQKCPAAAQLLDAAIHSRNFSDCPSPQDWFQFYQTVPGFMITPPSLDELPAFSINHFTDMLNKCRPAAPLWPAPSLQDMPIQKIQIPKINAPKVELPADPWSKQTN